MHCIGIGVVAATKDTNTDQIFVYIPSMFPNADGRISANPKQVERTSLNAQGEEVKSNLLHSNVLPAVWKNMTDGNRTSSPDVREGSKVAIYQVPGQNKLYWTLDGVNVDTMRLETVFYNWSASPEVSENTPGDINNTYQMKVSTHEGLMALRTSQANGEKVAFDIQINAMDGVLHLGGSENGFIVWDELNHSFTYTNADGAVFKVDKKSMTVVMPDTLNLFIEKNINIKTETLKLQAKLIQADVELTQWKGRWEHTGDVAQIGDYTQTGNFTQEGDYEQTGDTNRTGNSTSTGVVRGLTDVQTATVSLNLHEHAGVQNGEGITTPPIPA
jgi:hypothetical protein